MTKARNKDRTFIRVGGWLLLLMVAACHQEEKQGKAIPGPVSSLHDTLFSLPLVSTAREIKPCRHLPPGFYLDSVYIMDSILNHRVSLYYPVSETDGAFNRRLMSFMSAQEK